MGCAFTNEDVNDNNQCDTSLKHREANGTLLKMGMGQNSDDHLEKINIMDFDLQVCTKETIAKGPSCDPAKTTTDNKDYGDRTGDSHSEDNSTERLTGLNGEAADLNTSVQQTNNINMRKIIKESMYSPIPQEETDLHVAYTGGFGSMYSVSNSSMIHVSVTNLFQSTSTLHPYHNVST